MKSRQATRQRWLGAIALVLLAGYALLGVRAAGSAQQRLSQASRELSEVKAMLAEMDRLQQAPKVAALQLQSPAQITNRIAAARQAAGLPEASLLREQPLDPQRIQRSDFQLRATMIDLAPASLPQALAFCEALRDEETGTVVRDLKLTVPQAGEDAQSPETWATSLTLTQMIFSPKSR